VWEKSVEPEFALVLEMRHSKIVRIDEWKVTRGFGLESIVRSYFKYSEEKLCSDSDSSQLK